ncbi:hypothetical protein VTK26DRAFT_1286 [Humicola hyalothermophila]
MAPRAETADLPPTESSPLLVEAVGSDEQGNYVSIPAVPPNEDENNSGGAKVLAAVAEEEIQSQGSGEVEETGAARSHVARIIFTLLIGIFVAHADGSILLATHSTIASEFNDLGNSSWLITSFALAGAATQTLYGKLSDIYGRKSLVLIAYAVFMIGCAIVGMGQTMWQVILGRIISGAGASGMTALVSILITDLFPIREVAQWRAYVNLVATIGRSIGGPLGGWLVDVIGWRWSFFGQLPPIALAIVLVAVYLPNLSSAGPDSLAPVDHVSKSKFSRIDFKGSVLFALTVLALLLPIELAGNTLPWSHPTIPSLVALSAVFLFVFVAVEKRQREPILPLAIFKRRDAVLSFLILGFQTAAQLGLMFSVPLYFQITTRASNTAAGAHLVPAVVGNALGGLISGVLIKRSGRYKPLILLAVTLSSLSYLTLMLRWHGATGFWESLYIFPSGFGTGVAQSAVFVSLQAVLAGDDDAARLLAPAISFMYLSSTVAITIGLPLANAVMQTGLRAGLSGRLVRLGLGADEVSKIIDSTISDVNFIDHVAGNIRNAIVESYVSGLWWSHGVSFLFSASAFVIAVVIRERPLEGPRP